MGEILDGAGLRALTPADCGSSKEGGSSRKVTLIRSTDNLRHLHQLHRARKLERDARSDINRSADCCSFEAPEIG
jgi:hypothetical protein